MFEMIPNNPNPTEQPVNYQAMGAVMAEAAVNNMKPETVPNKPYTFRRLGAVDVFPMMRIISKIGVNEFTACFEKDGIKALIAGGGNAENFASIVGVSVALEIANVIFSNLPKCEAEIYQMLSQTSNLSMEQVKALDFVTFTEMVIDFIKKDEFKDFIKVVSKLFK